MHRLERHKEKMIEIIDINRSKANKVTMIKKNMNRKVTNYSTEDSSLGG